MRFLGHKMRFFRLSCHFFKNIRGEYDIFWSLAGKSGQCPLIAYATDFSRSYLKLLLEIIFFAFLLSIFISSLWFFFLWKTMENPLEKIFEDRLLKLFLSFFKKALLFSFFISITFSANAKDFTLLMFTSFCFSWLAIRKEEFFRRGWDSWESKVAWGGIWT